MLRASRHRVEDILRESPSLTQAPKLCRSASSKKRLSCSVSCGSLCDEADDRATRDVEQLKARGRKEAHQLRSLLSSQRSALERRLRDYEGNQLSLADLDKQKRAQRQAEAAHMRDRLEHIDEESKSEPRTDRGALPGRAATSDPRSLGRAPAHHVPLAHRQKASPLWVAATLPAVPTHSRCRVAARSAARHFLSK